MQSSEKQETQQVLAKLKNSRAAGSGQRNTKVLYLALAGSNPDHSTNFAVSFLLGQKHVKLDTHCARYSVFYYNIQPSQHYLSRCDGLNEPNEPKRVPCWPHPDVLVRSSFHLSVSTHCASVCTVEPIVCVCVWDCLLRPCEKTELTEVMKPTEQGLTH